MTLLCLCALYEPAAWSQTLYGTVIGTVEDPSGAVVPNASVSLASKSTGANLSTKSDDQGRFTFNNVLAGTYDLSAKADGFKPVTQTGLEVVINVVNRTTLRLEVGSSSESVTVSGGGVELQTDTSQVSANISQKAVTTLPLNAYRNYQALINLVPGTTPALFQNSVNDTPARSLTTNVNGTARNNNNTRVDGAANVFVWLPHHALYVAPAETIETVNVSTNAFDAEQGMAGGASVTVTTKSGTNEFHGVGFAYHDNQKLRSRNFFLPANRQKPRSTTNIDGGTFSGPIIKNKLFFFGGYEGTFERLGSTGSSSYYTVATADQREGNFGAYSTLIYDPLTGNANGTGRTAFAGNTIPVSRLSQTALKVQNYVPQPNLSGTTNNFYNVGTQAMDRHNWDLKVNYNRNEKHAIWGKYSRMNALVTCQAVLGDAVGPGLCSGSPGTGDTKVQLATVGHTYTLSPTIVIDGTFGYTRLDQDSTMPGYGTNVGLDTLGIPGTNGSDIRQSGWPSFAFSTGYTTIGTTAASQPSFRHDSSYSGTTNVSWVRGGHNLRFGVDIVRHAMNHWQPEVGSGPRGGFTFNAGTTALNGGASPNLYNAYASFLLGLPYSEGKSVQNLLMTTREWQYGFYIRDRWQASRNLTLNIGLRWELYPTLTRADRGLERWDPATNLVTIGGIADNPDDVGVGFSKKLFAPRVGFAYRLGQKSVIRSGYGITFDPLPVSRPLRGPYPATIAATFQADSSFSYVNTLASGIPAIATPDLTSGSIVLPGTVENRSPYAGTLKRGYIQSWNFILERELPGAFIGTLGYVGTKTTNQFADKEINAAGPGGGNNGRPLAALYGRTANTWMWNGYLDANYHSMQASLNKSFSSGAMIRMNYTWSKAINMTDEDGWTTDLTFNWDPVFNRNRAVAGYDRTHAFTVGGAYELPFGKGKRFANTNRLAMGLLGGWQTNGTLVYYSGGPFSVTADGSTLNAPGNTQTADQVGEVVYLGGIGTGQPYYATNAFAAVTGARFGTTGRNTLRGPGLFNTDMSIFRTFAILERINVQFKAEAFNLTNTPKFSNPAANVSTPGTFLQITSTRSDVNSERQFRFGLRLNF
nr:TonB-dependent receptor [uncultured Paludibaculum sp.]